MNTSIAVAALFALAGASIGSAAADDAPGSASSPGAVLSTSAADASAPAESMSPRAWEPSLAKCVHIDAGFFYPPPAIRQNLQGRVTYDYSLDASGKIERMKLVLAEPNNKTFVPLVLRVLSRWKCAVPANWSQIMDPTHMYRITVIFQLRGMPPVAHDASDASSTSTLFVTGDLIRR
jgi:TonB family protein